MQHINVGRLMSESGMNEPMTGERSSQPDGLPVGKASPGAQLAAQRQILGWSVEQVAEQLKLAPRQVLAIETDNYGALPGMATVRGFIRAYAKIVKLDATPLVALIAVESVAPVDAVPARRDMAAPFSEVRLPSMHRRGIPVIWLLVAGVVLVLGGVLAGQKMGWIAPMPANMWAKAEKGVTTGVASAVASISGGAVATSASVEALSGAASDTASAADKAPEPAQSTVVDASAPQIVSAPLPVPAPVSAPMAADAAAHAPVTTPGLAANAASAAVKAATPGGNLLVLKMRKDSWIEVKRMNAPGAALIHRVLKAGTTESVEIKDTTQLIVGNVEGVEATLRGTPLQLKSGPGNTARITLK
jgi:cytoskeleton protein RodZ